MSKRSLTDELESVLRAHSLEAPAPADTIAGVLARTEAREGQPDHRVRHVGSDRWRRGVRLAGAAAAAALIVLTVAVVNSERKGNSSLTAARDSAKSGGAEPVGSAAPAYGSANPQALNSPAPDLPPRAFADPSPRSRGQVNGMSQPPTCSIGHDVASSARGTSDVVASDSEVSIVRIACAAPDGMLSASQLDAVRTTTGQFISTVVGAAEQVHVDYVLFDAGTIRVTGSWWGDVPPVANGRPAKGSVLTVSYATGNGGKSFVEQGPATLVATPCAADDLRVNALAAPDGPVGRTALIRFQNGQTAPCAIEGPPALTATSPGISDPVAVQTPSGRYGGMVHGLFAPVIVLAPGGTATAYAESAAGPDGCPTSTAFRVGLRAVGTVANVKLRIETCGLQVHPVLPGFSGKD